MLNLMMICRKAGKLVMGFDAAVQALEKKESQCIITTSDISAKTSKEVAFYCNKYNAKHIESSLSKEDIGSKFSKQCAVLAICDEGFAKAFAKLENKTEK